MENDLTLPLHELYDEFVLCMSLHGEESILAMSVVLVCLAVNMEMFGFFA